jgi:hypothetical protein
VLAETKIGPPFALNISYKVLVEPEENKNYNTGIKKYIRAIGSSAR